MDSLRVGDRAEVLFDGRWLPKGTVAEIEAPRGPHGSGVVRIGTRWYPRRNVRAVPGPDERLDRERGYCRKVESER